MQDADQVVRGLTELAALLLLSGAPKFKLNAYRHAVDVVKTVGDELGPLVEQNRLRELQGIGASLSALIEELWNTGTSEYLQRLRSEQPEGAAELVQIAGMTPRRIRALNQALGVRSIDDLEAACAAGRVRSVAGFGEKTELALAAACKRWRERGTPPRRQLVLAAALDLAEPLLREAAKVATRVELAGALRRGQELVGELEMVAVGEREPILKQLASPRQVLRMDFEAGVAHLSEGVELKIHVTEAERLGNTLFEATGSAAHITLVQEYAARRSASAEHVLSRNFSSEAALYDALGLALVPPELREGKNELERAASEGFDDLLTLGDVQGLVHCHTVYSDGRNSVLEMAQAAHALGMKYITITDHSPSAHYARGVTLDRLKQQWDEIAAAAERVPIRILRGTESDILSDGLLDFPDSVLEQFDVVIASIHARHRMDRAAMTERLERALSLPLFKIWGHALGRILNHRAPIDCDVPRLLDVLAKSRGAIELNADPHRLDLPPEWIPAARERGIPFVVGVDAHSVNGFDALRYGVTVARRGGLKKTDVLNTESADAFAEAVRPVPRAQPGR